MAQEHGIGRRLERIAIDPGAGAIGRRPVAEAALKPLTLPNPHARGQRRRRRHTGLDQKNIINVPIIIADPAIGRRAAAAAGLTKAQLEARMQRTGGQVETDIGNLAIRPGPSQGLDRHPGGGGIEILEDKILTRIDIFTECVEALSQPGGESRAGHG